MVLTVYAPTCWTVLPSSALNEILIELIQSKHTDVDGLWCCDDKGHDGCVVDLATVSGGFSSGCDTQKSKQRHSRQEAKREEKHNNMHCQLNTRMLFVFVL